MAPVSLAEVSSLNRLARNRQSKSWWNNKRRSMLCSRELLYDASVRYTAVWTNTGKCQIRVGASVPAARMKAGHVLWVVEKDKVVQACPSSKALLIGTAGSITPVYRWTIKITSIENRVRKHREIRRLQLRR